MRRLEQHPTVRATAKQSPTKFEMAWSLAECWQQHSFAPLRAVT